MPSLLEPAQDVDVIRVTPVNVFLLDKVIWLAVQNADLLGLASATLRPSPDGEVVSRRTKTTHKHPPGLAALLKISLPLDIAALFRYNVA